MRFVLVVILKILVFVLEVVRGLIVDVAWLVICKILVQEEILRVTFFLISVIRLLLLKL